jgi:hypothetical protein
VLALLLSALAAGAQDRPAPPQPPERGGVRSVLPYIFGSGFIVQILAIVHVVRRGRERFWIFIIIIGGLIGALAYFVIEAAPDWNDLQRSFKGPAQRKRIAELRAIVLDNPSAGNYEELGELLVQQKKWSEARTAFDRALAARSDLPDTFYLRGVAAFEMGDDSAAIADFQHVVRINPKHDYARAQCLLARALARSGRTDEANAAFDRLVESSTSAESLVTAAQFYAANGRRERARELTEAVLARRATMPAYQKRRDRVWLRMAKKLAASTA